MKITSLKLYDEFKRSAMISYAEAQASGKGYDTDEMHNYLRAKVQGQKVKRPELITWHK